MVKKIETKNIEEYLKKIGEFPLLDPKEEKKLQERVDIEENRQKLFNSNLRVVMNIVKEMLNYGVETEYLIEVGNEGLEKAIDNYNNFAKSKDNLSPSTYYIWRIKGAIVKGIIDKNFPIFADSIFKSLKKEDFDKYYLYFFLEQILINLITKKENDSEDAYEILESSLISTFSDPNLKSRMSGENFVSKTPEFKEILKKAYPEIYKNIK